MVVYRKIAAGLLLLVYLQSAFAARELFKIPLLVHHYLEHMESNRSLTPATFFSRHYSQQNDGDRDEQEDRQLPFRESGTMASIQLVLAVPPATTSLPELPSLIAEKYFSWNEWRRVPQPLYAIWQPPRYC